VRSASTFTLNRTTAVFLIAAIPTLLKKFDFSMPALTESCAPACGF